MKGADIDATDLENSRTLDNAVTGGQAAVVDLLLEKGATIEATDTLGYTALHGAASHRNEAKVQLLLARGANLDAKSDCGRTALYCATEKLPRSRRTIAISQRDRHRGQDFIRWLDRARGSGTPRPEESGGAVIWESIRQRRSEQEWPKESDGVCEEQEPQGRRQVVE